MEYLFFCMFCFPFLVFLKNITLNITNNNETCAVDLENHFCDFEQAIGNISNDDIIEIYCNDPTNLSIKIYNEIQIQSKLFIK